VSKAFFLTRQTEKLMEDFIRELNADSALYLLYGDEGVGKTRTLEEMAQTRLGDSRIHWIDLQAGGTGDGALIDSSAMIESVFDKAQTGDVVIADHFEMALKKSRHQLFLSWTANGIDKKLDLIIAGNDDYFTEMCQLAQHYQVRVQSFQLMPLSTDEATAFLEFYLFPDRSIGNLTIPPLLRDQLTLAQGNVGSIVEIAKRAGDQTTTGLLDDTQSVRQGSHIIVGVLIAVALVIGAGWYFSSSQRQQSDMHLVDGESFVNTQAAPAEVDPQPDAMVEKQPATTAESTPVTVEMVEIEVADEAQAPLVVDAAVSEPAPPGEAKASVEETSDQTPALQGRLQRDLQASRDWVQGSDRKTGTLQIMLLTRALFNERVYYEYIDHLASRGVDIDTIRILETFTGGSEVYSVVYGEFDSWKIARNARDEVPKPLREKSPIPRSVGGLLDEMRRLEAEN
jgi:septal ring-binding cell division protein DamX